jgi:hypothetical protein
MKTNFGIILILFWIFSVDIFAQEDGGYPGAYLRNGIGTRAMGMGGAYVSLSNDVTGIYWNPAG